MRGARFVSSAGAAVLTAVSVAAAGVPGVAAAATPVASVPLETQVLVVGDSVGASVLPGLGHAGLRVVNRTRRCRLSRVTGPDKPEKSCRSMRAWRRAVRELRPKVVLWMPSPKDLVDVRAPGSGRRLVPGTPAWTRAFAAALDRTVDTLGSTGAQVVIPTIPYFGGTATDPERVRAANRVIARTAADQRGRLAAPDLNGYLSPNGSYQAALADVPVVRTDGVRFGRAGANLVGTWLAPQLARPLRGSVRKHRRPGPVRVLLVGDSITVNYENPTAAKLEAKGYEVSRTGVPQSSLLDAGVCDGTYAQDLLTFYDPDVVVFENNGNYALQPGIEPCAPRVEPGSEAFYKQWRSAARVNQRVLTGRGASFLWVLSPSVSFAPKRAMIPKINAIYRRLAGERHGLVDGWNALGGSRFDQRLRYDKQHLSGAGTALMAEEIVHAVR